MYVVSMSILGLENLTDYLALDFIYFPIKNVKLVNPFYAFLRRFKEKILSYTEFFNV